MRPYHFIALIQMLLTLPYSFAVAQETKPAIVIKLASPMTRQVIQRSSKEKGEIIISGWVTPLLQDAELPTSVEVRLTGAGGEGEWHPMPYDPRVPLFRGSLIAPAVGSWYNLEVRAYRKEKMVAEAVVEHFGIGEVFVIAGQSNSANHGEEKLYPRAVTSTYTGTEWKVANDPQPGASGTGGSFMPAFADEMTKRFQVPIGIVACGVGATSVREWLPRGVPFVNPPTLVGHTVTVGKNTYESDGTLYDTFRNRIEVFGKQGFRAVLWHQGESDANQRLTERTLLGKHYTKHLQQLIEASQQDCGWKMPWFVAQASYHSPDDPGSEEIRAAQKAVWDAGVALPGPDTDKLTSEFRDLRGKGVHFNGAGQREHGRLWAESVSVWLDKELEKGKQN